MFSEYCIPSNQEIVFCITPRNKHISHTFSVYNPSQTLVNSFSTFTLLFLQSFTRKLSYKDFEVG